MNKYVAPALGVNSFSCPHPDCRALAHQYWWRVFVDNTARKVEVVTPADLPPEKLAEIEKTNDRERFTSLARRLEHHSLTYYANSFHCDLTIANLAISRCHSCDGLAVWINGLLVYPALNGEHHPAADMPPDVKSDFEEAASILPKSPRGAAALLRLAIQRLMPHLGEKGKDLNDDIGRLVKRGLDPVVQQALDVVRVIGNNAVHPGTIDLDDDAMTASKLFDLVNLIVMTMITAKKQIAQMFEDLPESAKQQVERRDTGVNPGVR